jgi:hypothetical protein
MEVSYVRRIIISYLLLLLYSGPMMDLIQSNKKCSHSQQKKNVSCVLTEGLSYYFIEFINEEDVFYPELPTTYRISCC